MRFVVGGFVGALIVALVVSAGWGVSTKGELDTTKTQLGTAEASLVSERQRSDALTTANARLQSQADRQTACLAELRAEQGDMASLIDRYRANFDATATGSAWDTARQTQLTELYEVIDDYYQAYSAAFDGLKSSANDWIDKGNAAARRATAARDTMTSEVTDVNAETNALNSALAALTGRINSTAVTCSAAGPSS